MDNQNPSNTQASRKPWGPVPIITVIGLIILGVIVTSWILSRNSGTTAGNQKQENVNSPSVNSTENIRKDESIAPEAKNKPWNGGENIRRSQVVEVLPAGTDINTVIGGTGIMYEDESRKTTLIFVRKDSLQKVRSTCEGGGVKEPDRAPEIKGSFLDDSWIEEVMTEKEIQGVPCFVKENINVENLPYAVVGYTIFIGYSIQGGKNGKDGWDKWYFDQYNRAFKRRLPGAVSNGGGGQNCWALPL